MSKLEKNLVLVNIILYAIVLVFSYAYVDLNLTLSQNKLVLSIIGFLQNIGYYHRVEATLFYTVLIIALFSFFAYNLFLFYKNKIGVKYLRISTILNTFILVFAYPFLSSDLFNYLFDAKIILNYGSNPYTHRPLDFPDDEWLRFMRWVHRYSPYGPLWLGASLVPAILGFGKFILNFLTFKIFISLFHLINTFLIYKILKEIKPEVALLATAFYALNPLMLIEGIANAHNDVVLATLLIAPLYFFTFKKQAISYLSLLLGFLLKYIPVLNLPWLIWQTFSKNKNIKNLIVANLITMVVFTYVFSSIKFSVPFVSSGATQVQFQPWYLFWTLPFVAILGNFKLVVVFTALALGASFRYLPFLFYGDWSHPGTIIFMQTITLTPPILVIVFFGLRKMFTK